MTKNKRESEAKARAEHNKHLKKVAELEGAEKLKYDKNVVKRRLREARYDLNKVGHSKAIERKIDLLENQLKEINQKLEDKAREE